MKHWRALTIGLIVGCLAFAAIRWAIHPDRWEQSCIDRGGRVDSLHVTFEGGQQQPQDWQVCVINEQPQETRQV